MAEKRMEQSRLAPVEADFYTIGYEKMGVEDLFRTLKETGVHCLVDVRESPWSRVPGYRKKALEERINALGAEYDYHIRYISMPSLGNPRENRKSDRSMEEMLAVYRQYVQARIRELEELYQIIRKCKTALLCYEADPTECHRSVLAAILAERYRLTYLDLWK